MIQPYQKEPEWEEDQLLAASDSNKENDMANWVVWPPPSRVSETDWCNCGKCVHWSNREECVCCVKYAQCASKINTASEVCITAVRDFVCLHTAVPDTSLRG